MTPSDDDARPPPSVGSLARAIYLPSLLYGVGQGAVAPVIVITALELGAPPGVALIIAGLAGLGQLIANVPAGLLTSRIGERRAMHVAVSVVVVALVGCALAPDLVALSFAVLLTGTSTAVWHLARQVFMAEVIPYELRGRALSALGGVQRVGIFVGPFLGAGAIKAGGTDSAYWLHVALALAASVALVLTRHAVPEADRPAPAEQGRTGMVEVLRRHRRLLWTTGTATMFVAAVRTGRQAFLPLWATDQLGLDAAGASVVFALSGLAELLLVYPGGWAMDRHGRTWVGAISMAVIGSSFLLLLTLPRSTASLVVVALLVGIGNGLSSGVVMTIGADAAPPGVRAQFLGVFRLWSGSGMVAGPVLIGAAAGIATVGIAGAVLGGLGWLAAAALVRWTPRAPVG